MLAITLTENGYSGRSEGPTIIDASRYLELAELPVPKPAAGQVVIKVAASSVNPSDLHFIKGEYGQPRIKGAPAGFEGCGEVVKTGAGAEGLLGQRVAFVATPGGSGAWAEFALTDAAVCIPLRPEISDDDGAAQIVNPLTAVAMIDLAAQAGDAVVISAATSQLGKLMIGLAKDKELKTIALVRRADSAESLRAMGAATVLNVTQSDFSEQIPAICRQYKPKVFLDAVADQLSEQVFVAMPKGARWVCYGNLGGQPPTLTQVGQLIFMDKKIEGFWLTKWLQNISSDAKMRVVGEVQDRFIDGRWHTDISVRIKLTDVVSKLADACAIKGGKVIISP